tara:strand:+ start:592 stop:909 length:318 start_codon:yes stop_codon:yes gene_type:complete
MYFEKIIKPVLTEKMAILQEREDKYAFLVPRNANKNEIKKAIEAKFDVKVTKIATLNQSGKHKQMTIKSGGRTIRTSGKKASYKKAIITLSKGQVIDLIDKDTSN